MASVDDKLIKTMVVSPTKLKSSITATSKDVLVESTVGWNSDTAVLAVIDRVNSAGELTPEKMEIVLGMISENGLSEVKRGVGGRAQPHSTGALVETSIAGAEQWNRLIGVMLDNFEQSGKLKSEALTKGLVKAEHLAVNKEMGLKLLEAEVLGIGEWKEFAIGFGLNIKVLKIGRVVYWQTTGIANCGRSDKLGERIPEEFIPAEETILTTVAINSGPEYGTGVYRFRPDGSIGRWGATGHNEWLGSGCYIAKV